MELSWDPRSALQRPATLVETPVGIESAHVLTSNNCEDWFKYEADYKVLICKDHAGVQNLQTHLQRLHTVTAKERRAIVAKSSHHELLHPSRVPLPPPLQAPFDALGEPVNALLCSEEDCGWISINRSVIAEHCNKAHGWRSTKQESEHWSRVKAQTFFSARNLRQYFVVRVPDEQATTTTMSYEDGVEAAVIKQQFAEAAEKHKMELEIADKEVAKTDRTGWFNRTGWTQHLAGCNLKHLVHISRLPDRGETRLTQAMKVVDLTVERSVAGLGTLALETRRWLKSARQYEIDPRPMGRLQNPESQNRYTGYLRRLLCYLLRLAAANQMESLREDEESEEGSEDRSGAESDEEAEEESEQEEEESEGEEDIAKVDQDGMRDARRLCVLDSNQQKLLDTMWESLVVDEEEVQVEKMLKLLGSLIFQTVGDRPFSSPIIHFLAVLGIDEEMGRLRTADDFSYMLAGVVYCIRVVAMEILLPSTQREEQGTVERTHFLKKRRHFLADGSYSTMSTMLSLLAYAKSAAMSSSNAGNIQWTPDRKILLFHARRLAIERWQNMARESVRDTEAMLWNELMWLGVENSFQIPLESIVDDVTFTRRGVSFINVQSNGLTGGLEWMIDRMLASREGRTMRKDGRWNVRSVRRYLRSLDRFLELLLFCVHTTAGQPARGTEVTTARYQNGFLQDRNIYVIDGKVVLITRYHKSQSLFDAPKVIPRFLPHRVGQLMVVYLAYL